jgi:uncharacterized membrane protein YesL
MAEDCKQPFLIRYYTMRQVHRPAYAGYTTMSREIVRPPSIRIAFRTLGRTLRHAYENLFTLGVAGVFWLVCTVPFVPIIALAVFLLGYGSSLVLFIGVLLVGVGPPSAALHRIARPMTEERASSWNTFWSHLRADFGWSLRLSLTLLVILFLWLLNSSFYAGATNSMLQLVSGFFFVATIVWLGIMMYALPMALRQVEQSLRSTLRNAVVVALANLPGLIVSLILLFITTGILIVLPPLFLLVPGWVALWTEENVRLLLVASGHLAPDEIADRPRGS